MMYLLMLSPIIVVGHDDDGLGQTIEYHADEVGNTAKA
jgi:hypothetical protein